MRKLTLLTLAVTVFLSGCQSLINQQPPAPVSSAGTSEEALKQVNSAIRLLEQGRENEAEQLLMNVLQDHPNHVTAKLLIAQINVPPAKRYGNDAFTYTVKRGDTFGLLAKRYLGHSLEFYGLAKYNKITKPENLRVGQKLRIPKLKKQLATGDTSFKEIASLSQSNPLKALEELVNTPMTSANRAAYRDTLNQVLSNLKSNANDTNTEGYVEYLDRLLESNRVTDATSIRRIKYSYHSIKYQHSMHQARTAYYTSNDRQKAYQYIAMATKLPSNVQSDNDAAFISSVSEDLHGQAFVQFRQQNLKKAITIWEQVLEINPTHEAALTYKARAEKLLEQLNNIK